MVHPTPNGLVGHRHSALRQQILDVTQAEGEPEVEPYCLVNDLGRETIPGVADLVHPRWATRPPRTPQAQSAVTMPPSVWDTRVALHEMAGGGLDLLQLAFVDEAKGSVDRLLQVVFPVIQGGGEVGRDRVADLAQFQALGCGALLALSLLGGEPLLLGRLVPGQATRLVFLAASARAAIVASRLGHRGRVTFCRRTHPCTQRCWPTPDSMTSCSPLTVIWRMLAGPRAAPVAGAGTWRATPANPAAGRAVSGPSTTSASAFAAPSTAAVRGRRRRRCASSGAGCMSRPSSC